MQLAEKRNDGPGDGSVRLASAAGRWVLAVAVLGDSMILLEATVVNVALPTIGRDLGAGVAGLQWTLNSYVLTLAALILGVLYSLYRYRIAQLQEQQRIRSGIASDLHDDIGSLLNNHLSDLNPLWQRYSEIISRLNGFVPNRFVDMLSERIDEALK